MKKLLLTICSSLFCVLSYAQTEHLTFKGLPIDGSKQEFVKELKRCGYIVELGSDDCLSGEFVGRACLVIIHSTPRTDIVCGVTVIFEQFMMHGARLNQHMKTWCGFIQKNMVILF